METTASLLSAVTVFAGNNKVCDTVFCENNQMVFEMTGYENEIPEWASKLIDNNWVPSFILGGKLVDPLSTVVLARAVETPKGGSPFDDFVNLLNEENAEVVVKVGDDVFIFKPNEIRQVIESRSTLNNLASSMMAGNVMAFANSVNNIFQEAGLRDRFVNAVCEDSTVYLNFNCIDRPAPLFANVVKQLLNNASGIVVACRTNGMPLGIRVHKCASSDELSNTSFSNATDYVTNMSPAEMKRLTDEMEKKVNSAKEKSK